LFHGKKYCTLVIEHSGVFGEVGQGSVDCHGSCCSISGFEDVLNDGVQFVGNGVFSAALVV
jgi:hypothetical protein